MTNFLHWRKTTWALALWSGYIATWAVITGSGLRWSSSGGSQASSSSALFGSRRSQLFGQGRTLDGSVRPGSTHWRVPGLHRTNPGRSPGAMPVESERRSATVSEATRPPPADQLTSSARLGDSTGRRSAPPTSQNGAATTSRRSSRTVPTGARSRRALISAEAARIASSRGAVRARALRDWEDEGGTTPLLHGP